MTTLQLIEHESLPIDSLPAKVCRALQALDQRHARSNRDTVLDWSRHGKLRARNWVGVIQCDDTAIEILPKIATSVPTIRENLAHMLVASGRIPAQERDVASTDFTRTPLHEFFMLAFARRVAAELRRGADANYVLYRENSTFVRGKIEMAEHLRQNATRRERTFVAHDDHTADTPLNRAILATCCSMARVARAAKTRRLLNEAISHLGEVQLRQQLRSDLDRVTFHRGNERFRDLFAFCRNYLLGRSPTISSGDERTFSVLFPMERLFESYIAHSVRCHAQAAGIAPAGIHVQSHRWGHHLLRDHHVGNHMHAKRHLPLRPDIIIGSEGQTPDAVIDTKWKALDFDESLRQGVGTPDLYQVYAYAQLFGAPTNMLLYPHVPGLENRDYDLLGTQDQLLRVRFFDLSGNLRAEERSRTLELLANASPAIAQ